MKKLFVTFLLALTIIASCIGSFADEMLLSTISPSEIKTDISVDSELACSEYGTHRMRNTFNWVAVYYYGSPVMTYAGEYQCGCGEYFVCEGRPHLGHPIGKYYDGSRLSNRRSLNGITVYDANSYYPAYTSNPTIPGFSFSQAF